MRMNTPRIQPLQEADWNEATTELLAPIAKRGRVLNIFRTLAQHSDLARRWMVFANHILGKSTLSSRDRELLILRIGYLCQAEYEWGQHVAIARRIGMSDAEILLAKTGPTTAGISELDRSAIGISQYPAHPARGIATRVPAFGKADRELRGAATTVDGHDCAH